MMQTADERQGAPLPKLRRLHRPTRRRVLFQRQVRSRLVIILHIRLHVSAQRLLVENDDVVDALSPNRTDHALDVGPLPGGTRRRGTSSMPRCPTSLVKSAPKMLSRSRRRYRGTSSNGNASRSCCPVHSAVGCAVTLKCTIRRRS